MGNEKLLQDMAAEKEAYEIGSKFMRSTDVVGDMSKEYGYDFSDVSIHHDESAAGMTSERGVDAFASGNDVFFGKGIFESNSPESRGLLAHELTHTMQQGGGEGVHENAPEGAEQGGIIDWFKKAFGKKNPPPAKPKPHFALGQNSDDMRAAVNEKGYMKSVNDSPNTAGSLVNVGIRTSTTPTGAAHKKMMTPVFGQGSGLEEEIDQYWAGQKGQNFKRDAADNSTFGVSSEDKGIRTSGGQGKNVSDLFGMFTDKIENADNLQEYLDMMKGTVGQADVFNGGIGGDPTKKVQLSDYIMQTMMNTFAMGVSSRGTDLVESDKDKGTVKREAGRSLMMLPVLYAQLKSGEKKVEDLPPEIIPMMQKYMLTSSRLQGMIDGPQQSGFVRNPTTTHAQARDTSKGWVAPSYQSDLNLIEGNGGYHPEGINPSMDSSEKTEAFFISQIKQARALGDKEKVRFYVQQLAAHRGG